MNCVPDVVVSSSFQKLPISKPILKYLQCFDPKARSIINGKILVKNLGRALPAVLRQEEEIDALVLEWKILISELIPEFKKR